jgi:hypothetical protein
MNARAVGYWICTGVIAFSFLSGGAAHLLRVPQVVEGITQLGYPLYFVIILGVWKILGATAILLPGYPLLKEWAYAGRPPRGAACGTSSCRWCWPPLPWRRGRFGRRAAR